MKKQLLLIPVFAVISACLIFSCIKKKTDTRIQPTYKEDATGTGGNPNTHDQTVTGTATLTNPATQNSNLQVGGPGWSNPTCISTSNLYLKGVNGSIDVTLTFQSPPSVGTFTYNIAPNPGPNYVSMVVNNAPNQPSGIVWYAKTGMVTVNTSTSGIGATFSGILCTQQNFNFPTVGVSGTLGCN